MRRVLLAAGALLSLAGPAGAQQASAGTRVVIEYIAGGNLYLTAGSAAGLAAGDTLEARTASGARTGRLRVISSTADRAVVAFASAPFPVTRGDTVLVTVPAGRIAAAAPDAVRSASTEANARPADALRREQRTGFAPPAVNAQQRRVAPPPRLDGLLAFDFDAFDSRTQWGSLPSERSERRFVTPALRLHATLTQLPGGMRISTSARYEYRHADGAIASTGALRVYQASIEKAFQRLPLQLQLGRFYSTADLYGGYFDGGMLRLGGTGFGVGLAAGYAPDRANGGFATDVHKSSAFVDWSLANGRASYQGAVALHDESGGTSLAQRYLSVSQRVRLGRAFLLQRVRFDAAGGRGGWSLANLDLNALTPLAGDLLVRAHYGRRSFTWTGLGEPDTVRPHQERLGGGLLFAGAHISLGADLSLTQWDDGTRAATWSASLAVPRTPVAGIGFGATATRYGGEDGDSYFLAPYLTRLFGTVSTNLSYQRYRTGGGRADDYQAGLLALSFPLPGRMYASLRAQSQWGSAASGNRLFASLARSF